MRPPRKPNDSDYGMPVTCTYGFNTVTQKPFKFLYDFAYENTTGGYVVYIHGERNMQDSYAFKADQVNLATPEDLATLSWGS